MYKKSKKLFCCNSVFCHVHFCLLVGATMAVCQGPRASTGSRAVAAAKDGIMHPAWHFIVSARNWYSWLSGKSL